MFSNLHIVVHIPTKEIAHLTIKNEGKKWYDAEVQVTKGCAIPAVVHFIIAVMVYGFTGLMLYVACST